jgi:hypothetical protein
MVNHRQIRPKNDEQIAYLDGDNIGRKVGREERRDEEEKEEGVGRGRHDMTLEIMEYEYLEYE